MNEGFLMTNYTLLWDANPESVECKLITPFKILIFHLTQLLFFKQNY